MVIISMWSWVPICVRLIANNNVHAVSGIQVEFHHHGTSTSFWLTISPVPLSTLDEYEVYVASGDTIDEQTVVWIPARYHLHHMLTKNENFRLFLSQFLTNGFSLFPHNSVSSQEPEVSVLALSPKDHATNKKRFKHGKNLHFSSATSQAEISITSYPFSFTNPVLFSNFRSHGFINYAFIDNGAPLAYLTDTRYLENMAGGIVQLTDSSAIGLVIGNLRKRNGDGDLNLVCGWHLLGDYLTKIFGSDAISDNPIVLESRTDMIPVFPLVVGNSTSRSWGTCTYVSSVLVTNYHVLKPYIEAADSSATCTIYVHGSQKIYLSLEDNIITPFPELDLSFIFLSPHHLAALGKVRDLKPSSSDVNDTVYSVGYGLFYSQRQTAPLLAKGHISALSPLPFTMDESPIETMIVTSAPCWNGSSGGALVDSENKLVGIICSNAQVRVPEVAGTTTGQTEKLCTFCMCLPIALVLRCLEACKSLAAPQLNPDIAKLWTLSTTHKDVIESGPKL